MLLEDLQRLDIPSPDWRSLDFEFLSWRPLNDGFAPGGVSLDVDEMMASLDAGRGAAETAAGSGGGVGWLIILGLAVLAVLGMLMILVGQRRRMARDEPRGLDGFQVEDDYERFDDLATVEIAEPVEELPFDERVAAVVAADRAENVVPIRKREDARDEVRPDPREDERADEMPAYEDYHDAEPEPARYAFAAGGGAQMSADAPSAPASLGSGSLAMRTGGATGERRDAPRSEGYRDGYKDASASRGYEGGFASGGASSAGRDGDDAPFVAPFIREDIERSERRQADRLDGLRDEVHRQFQTMKNENAARLDLFVSTVDRKLSNVRGAESLSEAAVQHAVESALRPVFDRLDGIVSHVATQERRLTELATLVERRLPDLLNTSADIRGLVSEVQDTRADLGETAERMSARVGEIGGGMDTLRETIERLERALLDRATAEGASNVALTEVVRGTLPEGTYEFGLRLANGNTADCVISFEGSRERVAIDAGFPMEAFTNLPSRDSVAKNLPQAKAAEDVFRRAILRAILEAADRCIVPGDTTDSCLLFLPSEAAYTVLHDRFGDLVRDAQRARVWLTSPSTLMGTLNLLRNLMPEARTAVAEHEQGSRSGQRREHGQSQGQSRGSDAAERERVEAQRAAHAKEQARAREQARAEAERREKEREAMRAEIRALRERAAGLAGELDRTRGTLSDLIETTERLSHQDEARGARASSQPRGADLLASDTPRAGRYDDEDTGSDTGSGLSDWPKDEWSKGGWAEDDRDDPFEDE